MKRKKALRRCGVLALVSLLLCLTACGEAPAAEAPEPDPAMPTTAAQILQFYNDAVTRAVDSRMSFAKRFRSEEDKFSLSPALEPFKSRFRDATGVGRKPDDVIFTPQSEAADDCGQLLRRPSLTAQDVRSAKCTLTRDGLYSIELQLADGESCVEPGKNEYVSALDKCGVAAGDPADANLDHRTAQNIYESVRGFAQDVRIREKHTGAVVDAVFRPDGTPVQLTVRFDAAYDVRGVYEIGLSAKGTTTVRYVQFGAESPVFPEEE